MAIAIDEKYELQFSGYSASATTIKTSSTENDYDLDCNWNNWSAVFDWENLSGDYFNDFGDPVHYSTIEDEIQGSFSLYNNLESESQETCDSVSTDMMFVDEETNGEDTKGLRLVHLLMAAAESLTGVNKSTDLARVILVRLKELVSPNDGSNMERLAAYFTDALQGLLEGVGSLHGNKHTISNGPYHNDHRDRDQNHRTDMVAAFQLLQDMSPCAKFGHFTANQAILEAVAQDRRVHIVDYDMMEGIQWASLMQALVSRKDGPSGPHLRITAMSRVGNGRRSMGTVQETGRRLTAFAASIGLPFSFHQCRLDSDETFRPAALKLIKGEALIINCVLHLPHFNYRTPDSIMSFLLGVKTVNPRLVTLVEEVTGSTGDGGFLGRFMDSLHHFSALYDSLEAGFPMQSRARALVERVFLGPRIANSVAMIYRTRGEDEGCSWWERLGSVGFDPVNISFANHCQAKLLLGLFNDGYKVEALGCNRLVLGWKYRQLLSASIWTSSSEPDF